jgi:hypothetical protein
MTAEKIRTETEKRLNIGAKIIKIRDMRFYLHPPED